MSNISNETPVILKESLTNELQLHIQNEGLEITSNIVSDLFKNFIRALYDKYNKRVVILIDEYDKPILDHLNNPDIADANREILRGFYGVIKSLDKNIWLTFITGVTKFTKTSIFSGLNNLRDITLSRNYANICGITEEDLAEYFNEHINNIASVGESTRYEDVYDGIIKWYDGYSWDARTRVINPHSLLNFLIEEKYASYWFESGTPKFLLDLIKRRPKGYVDLKSFKMSERAINNFDINNIEVEPLLFQTGYLTIKEIIPASTNPIYLLDMPNYEVTEAFNLHILAEFTGSGSVFSENAYIRILDSLKVGNIHNIPDILRALFASIPYEIHMRHEYYYHSIFFAIMNLLGFEIDAEVSVSGGRIDAVLELDDIIYIMEFKYADCPPDASCDEKKRRFSAALDEGMKQIKDRGYAKKYLGNGKDIYHAAFAFLGRDNIEMRVEKPYANPDSTSDEAY